jgi:cupin 2 domain-containing protein
MTKGYRQSFFEAENAPNGSERFEPLFQKGAVVIERIVSSGEQPVGRYCQTEDEWVMLVRGTATLRIEDTTVQLKEGDYVTLPAKVPHEVLETSTNALWLAVHVHPHTSTSL